MTANQIDMQLKKIKYQENKQAKELFEEDLRKSVNKTVNSGTGLFTGTFYLISSPIIVY